MRRYSKPKNEKLPPFATSTIRLFSSLISTRSFAISSRIRFSTAFISQSRRGWESIDISRSSAKRAYRTEVYFPRLNSNCTTTVLSQKNGTRHRPTRNCQGKRSYGGVIRVRILRSEERRVGKECR